MAKTSSEFDYNEYDSISLALKENESERMLGYYKAFGWEEYEIREDKRYFDIVHIKLKRRHKIRNKDRLQLLQVKMESVVNRFALARKNKHSKSIIAGLTLGVLALAFLTISIMLFVEQILIPLSAAFFIVGIALSAAIAPVVKSTVKKENQSFAVKFKEMTSEISRIIFSAEKLYGGEKWRNTEK